MQPVRWTTAFVDMADDVFAQGAEFWAQVTESSASPVRGEHQQFATLIPATGDPYVRVQRTGDGSSKVHLDLHVSSVIDAQADATSLGATTVHEAGFVTMASPGGFVFCFVDHHGESTPPAPVGATHLNCLDQLCIDIPPAVYDDECVFWQALTGWKMQQSKLAEFRSLERPADIPLRFLLQRLESAEVGQPTHAHLDIACGHSIDQVAEVHVALGAAVLGRTKVWMQMRDPAGLVYCLTPREPVR